jgi:small-conductance mechanosensitive channel
VPLVITLDQAHLQAGSFTYGRQSNRVDVGLTIQAANGRNIREVSTYVGALPEKTLQDPDQSLQKERDALAKETESLKADLKKQAERTRRLENSVDQMRLELIRQQRIRLQNMNPDAPHPPNN